MKGWEWDVTIYLSFINYNGDLPTTMTHRTRPFHGSIGSKVYLSELAGSRMQSPTDRGDNMTVGNPDKGETI